MNQSHEVLALKWRPSSLTEVVGNTSIIRAITGLLNFQKIHHAYLITGTRGVGKTTIARIIARSLSCKEGISANPCGVCPICLEIDQSKFIDLIEIDAASRTKVEDMREILDNLKYTPSIGRFKIYIIDEAHMLSNHSFNALLKSLEEPPAHVKFILATTEPNKIPPTILSRCLKFSLRGISADLIYQRLADILNKENYHFSKQAVQILADAADGSLRDAITLTEQAIIISENSITVKDVCEMLGVTDKKNIISLLYALAQNDVKGLLTIVSDISAQFPDWDKVLAKMLDLLHWISIAQLSPSSIASESSDKEELLELSRVIPIEDTQLFYQIALIGRKDLPITPDLKKGFEMILFRMLAFCPSKTKDALIPIKDKPKDQKISRKTENHSKHKNLDYLEKIEENFSLSNCSEEKEGFSKLWKELCPKLSISGITAIIATNSVLVSIEKDHWSLHLDPRHSALLNDTQKVRIQNALSKYKNHQIKVSINLFKPQTETPFQMSQRNRDERLQLAKKHLHEDPLVIDIIDNFDASILEDTLEIVDPKRDKDNL